ncbi:MAG: iron-containing redox enzyme family protein [Candidatus Peribacteraceae bacterium]
MSLASFDSLIASKSLLKHPFYVRWTKGELSIDDMKVYAREYYALVSAVPEVVAIVLEKAKVERPEIASFIEKNLHEEQEHVALWERFASSMGITKKELVAYVPSNKMQSAIQDMKDAVSVSLDAGISAVYAFERELPEIAKTKKEGLIAFYGLTSEDAHVYFDEHLNEEEHLKVWRDAAKNADKSAVMASMTAQNKALDAVCEVAGIPCSC